MSAHELPADLAQWPENPYELLGVSHETSARDLKRAYARLIRTYKPELYPEHFRRIREAYENAVQYLEWSLPFRMAPSEEEPAAEPIKDAAEPCKIETPTDDSDGTRRVPATLPPRTPSLEEQIRELWQQACAGNENAAYQGLKDRHVLHPGHPEICLRCYWLLTLWPQLDRWRSAVDWLIEGLRAHQLTGPLFELYRRELASDWKEAIEPRREQLLETSASPWAAINLAESRWRAASHAPDVMNIIERDQNLLHPRMLPDAEECWLQLLVTALGFTVWEKSAAADKLSAACCREIQALEHLHVRLSGYLDQLDLLLETGKQWHSLAGSDIAPDLLSLIRLSWISPPGEVRVPLLRTLQRVAEQPGNALWQLDFLKQHAPLVLFRFSVLLNDLQEELELAPDPRNPDTVTALILDFVKSSPWYQYRTLRGQLLDFCRREAVTPEQVAESIAADPKYQATADQHLAHLINDDWPLRYVCQASRRFWAA